MRPAVDATDRTADPLFSPVLRCVRAGLTAEEIYALSLGNLRT